MSAGNGTVEIPIVFDCNGENLVGIVHRPQNPKSLGLLTVVAGGPQYRAGVGRGLVSMGRELAALGFPVLRFDHRGLGDSSGDFLGFEHLESDLRAAIAAFQSQVPEIKRVVLWGGCDAASGIMIHARSLPEVTSIVVGNPFVSSSETQAAVVRQHYLKRLTERSFWRKLLKFEYRIGDYGREALAGIKSKFSKRSATNGRLQHGSAVRGTSFIERMLNGLQDFHGPVLFLMSGQSLVSKEFDELVTRSPAWKAAYSRDGCERVDFPDADQAFSSQDAKARVNAAVADWFARLEQEKSRLPR